MLLSRPRRPTPPFQQRRGRVGETTTWTTRWVLLASGCKRWDLLGDPTLARCGGIFHCSSAVAGQAAHKPHQTASFGCHVRGWAVNKPNLMGAFLQEKHRAPWRRRPGIPIDDYTRYPRRAQTRRADRLNAGTELLAPGARAFAFMPRFALFGSRLFLLGTLFDDRGLEMLSFFR
jgi:hypothetical protein